MNESKGRMRRKGKKERKLQESKERVQRKGKQIEGRERK